MSSELSQREAYKARSSSLSSSSHFNVESSSKLATESPDSLILSESGTLDSISRVCSTLSAFKYTTSLK